MVVVMKIRQNTVRNTINIEKLSLNSVFFIKIFAQINKLVF